MKEIVIAAAAAVILTLILCFAVFKRRERIMKSFIVSQAAEINRLRNRLNGASGFRDMLIEQKTVDLRNQVKSLKRRVIILQREGGLDEQGRDRIGLGA